MLLKWISVKDRLPEQDVEILFSCGKEIFLGSILKPMDEDERILWLTRGDSIIYDVRFWMPLPELPIQ